jgi:uncharacterized protein YndB with AHSA1/START domain
MSVEPVTQNMTITRVFDAPVEKVWKAWSNADSVMKWWGPTGFTAPLVELDFREGGTSLVCMSAPQEYGGFDMYNTWTYKKIIPLELIEFVNHFTDKDRNKVAPSTLGLPPDIPSEVPHTITFKKVGDNKTELTVTEYGYTSEETVNLSKSGMEQCLDKMAASLK